MQTLTQTSREAVYNAPILPYYTETYTPISNKQIMDLIEERLRQTDLTIKGQDFRTTISKEGLIKGVIGKYYLSSTYDEYEQQLVFRNSYDKSMSFAFAVGGIVVICTNGMVSGDYAYKRVHKGVYDEGISTTWYDIFDNVNDGFNHLEESFEKKVQQMEALKKIEVGPKETSDIVGDLFINKDVLTVSQISIVKRELKMSRHFKHLGDEGFSAFDIYQAITESLKTSHPTRWLSDHSETHRLFEETFGV